MCLIRRTRRPSCACDGGARLSVVLGYAGPGKSAMLGVAREAWEESGYHVHGLALSGIAAENLESGSGIASRTIASMEHQWSQGRDLLGDRDVLVIDEAGMIGSRQMERVLTEAERCGAKLVLIGDRSNFRQSRRCGAALSPASPPSRSQIPPQREWTGAGSDPAPRHRTGPRSARCPSGKRHGEPAHPR